MPHPQALANAIRALSFDAVQKANSGHPGMPMGMADIAEVLWNQYLNHNPNNPHWINRDRFILSNGHGSMLHYSLLHLSGYDVSIDDIKTFRQLHSKTPGHPEYSDTPGIETTTGPLGQGIANAIGMALAEKMLAAEFNQTGHQIINHHTYVFLGDGCLMEGVSHEACSLAGTWGLGKLIAFWDDNGISIDGEVKPWFSDNTPERFRAYGWQVIEAIDGHNANSIKKAIDEARANTSQPTLICCRTTIGYGSPNKSGKASSHGAPLGDDEIAKTRAHLQWTAAPFEIPQAIYQAWDAKAKGQDKEDQWLNQFEAYKAQYPELAENLLQRLRGDLPQNWPTFCQNWLRDIDQQATTVATRKASQMALETMGPMLPGLLGGSADLTGSNNTNWSGSKAITASEPCGNYINYGVREFGMSAIANGLALYGGFIPYTGTFLVFSDYARNAVRMAALMKQQQIFVYTHDSIGLGEDGPTHQPVEHITSLRLIPNLHVWRPCDAVETAAAWISAVACQTTPSALILSRQNLAHQHRDEHALHSIARGGYILKDHQQLDLIIIATGSEVALAMAAAKKLESEQGLGIRVVSMPCAEIFAQQDATYQCQVLPIDIATIAIEAGVSDFWYRYVGRHGLVIGMNQFGASAPAKQLFDQFGFSVDHVCATVAQALPLVTD